MKRFTLNLKQMLVAGMCLVGLSANAQYSQTIEQYPNTNYENVTASFKMTEVAATLGTDTATLAAQLEANAVANTMFALYSNASSDWTTAYNGDGPMFWIGSNGEVQNWGAGGVYFAELTWDSSADMIGFNFGQFPDSCKAGNSFTPKFKVVFGDKNATFDVTYNIIDLPAIPEPASVLASKQNVLGTQAVSITRTSMQGYDASTVTFDAKTIADALGIQTDVLKLDLSQMLYIQSIDSLGVLADSLTNESTANAPGWWMKNTVYPQGHEQQGENSGLLGAAVYGADDALFTEFSYSDDDQIQANVGQYPGSCKIGDKYVADFYVIYGDKAYKLTINTEIVKAETTSYPDLNVVGTQDYTVKVTEDEADYQAHSVTIDVDAVAAALGTTTDALAINAPANDTEFYVGNTAGNQGFWFDESGYVCNWGSTAATFVENATDGQYDIFNCGVYPGVQAKAGNTYTDKIYFVNGNDCYIVNFNFNIVQAEVVDQSTWEIVAKRPVVAYAIPQANYGTSVLDYTFTVDQMNELIGTTSPTMYCALADSLQNETTKYALATKYPCTPAPGAWLGDKGQGAGWGNNAYVGIMYSLTTGKYTICEMPNKITAPFTYTAPIYFVNDETHKMIEFDFTIQYVNDSSEMQKVEVVGSENMTLVVNSMDDAVFDFDLSAAAKALGVTTADLINQDNYYFTGMLASGLWNSGTTATQGFTFNMDGTVDTEGYGVNSMAFSEDGTQLTITMDEIADEATFKSQPTIGFKIDNKVYAYYLTLYTEASKPTAVTGDVNGDGSVDIADVNAIISVICGGDANSAADVNSDNTVDIADVNSVIGIICANAAKKALLELEK